MLRGDYSQGIYSESLSVSDFETCNSFHLWKLDNFNLTHVEIWKLLKLKSQNFQVLGEYIYIETFEFCSNHMFLPLPPTHALQIHIFLLVLNCEINFTKLLSQRVCTTQILNRFSNFGGLFDLRKFTFRNIFKLLYEVVTLSGGFILRLRNDYRCGFIC